MAKNNHLEVKNKDVRRNLFMKMKKEKAQAKKKSKILNKGKPKEIPKTIENCRIKDETFISDFKNDPEIQLDLKTDELGKSFFKLNKNDLIKEEDTDKEYKDSTNVEEEKLNDVEFSSNDNINSDPKMLITTHNLKISFKTYKLCRELSRILPNSEYFYRKNIRLSKVIPEAIRRNYSAIIVINEDRKEPNGMMISILPDGPTLNFKLNSVKLSNEIKGGGGFTQHKPEIILNNFNTRLGLQIGRTFATLFPHDPEYQGRHCITFHNQRDFIFFRHHRYIFRNSEKVGLQELGPRFTLKLKSLQKGMFNSKFGEYEWVQKRHEVEKNRRQFSL